MLSKYEERAGVMAGGLVYQATGPINGKRVIPMVQEKALPLSGFVTSDLFNGYEPVPYIMKNVILHNEIIFAFGESGAMKSFFAIDVAGHIAAGMDYYGHKVHQTGVVYIAGEGGQGLRPRAMAWMTHHHIDASSEQPKLYVATEQANLMFDGGQIKATIEIAERVMGCEVGFVVFDTLSANFGAGDESRAEDIGRVLQTARASCGDRAILFVHHVGHGDKTRERGSYALRAAADRRIFIERPEGGPLVTVSCVKAKDDIPFKPMVFEWHVVDVGWVDADGDPITSVVLTPSDKQPDRTNTRIKTDGKPLDYVRQAIAICGSNQREVVRTQFYAIYGKGDDANRKAFNRGWAAYMEEVCK